MLKARNVAPSAFIMSLIFIALPAPALNRPLLAYAVAVH
jgi:hypothetical protein